MPALDPAKQLAREMADLRREVRSQSRGSQAAHRAIQMDDGSFVSLPDISRSADAAASAATVALDAANGKNRVVYSVDAATSNDPGTTVGDVWFQRSPVTGIIIGSWEWDGTEWAPRTFGDSVLNSLTVAKLVTGEIAAGQRVSAGPVNGTHAEMTDTGFRVYAADPVDGIPNEVARMGTSTNDYFAIVDEDGNLTASIDDTGSGNFTSLSVTGDPVLAGRKLSDREREKPWGLVAVAQYSAGAVGGITTSNSIGLLNCSFTIQPGRAYRLSFEDVTLVPQDAGMEYGLRLVATTGNPAPAPSVTTSLVIAAWRNNHDQGRWSIGHGSRIWYGGSPAVPTECRLLLYMWVNTPYGGTLEHVNVGFPTINIEDVGPLRPSTGSIDRGGGSTPPPVRQYDTGDLAASGWASYRGDGTARTDVAGPVQGWDPSGYNGNGKGYWWWDNLPSITGNVDRVDVYLYSEHWYYNSGGTARINAVPSNLGGSGFGKARSDWDVGGWPKPGGKWVTLPPDWWPLFLNSGAYGHARVNGISVGPGAGTDLNYYGRFSGSAARMRIWYTQ